jgi:hypothetical protein
LKDGIPSGLKPNVGGGADVRAEQAAEECRISVRFGENIPQGPKPIAHSIGFAAVGVETPTYQSCPDTSCLP